MALYPSFPNGGKPLFFSTFDPKFRQEAANVLCNESSPGSGGGMLYYPSNAFPSVRWAPAFAMYCNAGNVAKTPPILWTSRVGPRPAMWIFYSGGDDPT